jgi:capsid protein
VAAIDLSNWMPEDYASDLVQLYGNSSAIESVARSGGRVEPMKTDTKKIPRDADADVVVTPTGMPYTEDTKTGDNIQLDASKLTHLSKYNEEDLEDAKSWVNATESKKRNATSNLALLLDNAAIGVTGDRVDESPLYPYTSVYNDVKTNASSNLLKLVFNATLATMQTNTKTALDSALGIVEDGPWSSEDLVWIMSPAFKAYLRQMDATGAKGINYFVPQLGGSPDNGISNGATLAGYPIYWSRSARVSAVATHKPTSGIGVQGALGNALAVLAPRKQLVLGDRAPLESMYLDPKTGIGALSDAAYLKMRRRVAYKTAVASSVAVIEVTSA